ncbi:MAG: DeoR family transcriptional regulator [Patescibacteria group bacterium]
MNRNFFIRLAFAAHRVADVLPQEEQIAQEIREAANVILADLILLTDKEITRAEKKQDLLFQLERQIDVLLVYLDRAKEADWVNSENFSLLESEYGRIRELLEIFEDIPSHEDRGFRNQGQAAKGKKKQVISELPKIEKREEREDESVLTGRQKRIIEFLRTKENAQVWELQKVLPEVTKRTLRRDLDELLQKNLVERKGAWNAVSYELK